MPAWLLPAAISAAGFLLDRFGKKPKNQTTTNTTTLDPQTQAYNDAIRQSATAGANVPGGIDPNMQAALDYFRRAQQAGGVGLGALSGNQADIDTLYNPYQKSVVDQVRNQYGLLNSQAQNAVNDSATQARAFGGSRHGVASGVAYGEISRLLGNKISGLEYQGYNDAMTRAQGLAGLGGAGAAGGAGLSEMAQIMSNPELRKAYLLKMMGSGLPYGQTTTSSTPINYPSAGASALGYGLTGLGLYRPGSVPPPANLWSWKPPEIPIPNTRIP